LCYCAAALLCVKVPQDAESFAISKALLATMAVAANALNTYCETRKAGARDCRI
jgi:hypothetical protein